MKTGKIIIFTIMTLCSFSLLSAGAAASTPKESIKVTVDAVMDVISDSNLSKPGKKQERRRKIRELIQERFDLREMSKRSLARHWKKRTPEEADEFVRIFSDLLVASYIGKIEAYTDEKVTYDKEVIRGKGKYGIVSTTIISKKVDIPIDYKVIFRNGEWRVYDVVVEGVSFISTYRSQYNKIIVRESYAGLIKKMKTQLEKVNSL